MVPRKYFLRTIQYLLLLWLLVFLFQIFLPRNYAVPAFQKRPGTQYWNLSTGSAIGYTFIPAKIKKQRYPIIYLHGGPGGCIAESNIRILSALAADGFDVYLYDQVGSGQSGRLSDIKSYTVDRHIKDLKEIIHTIAAEKVILIGQSWGAVLAVLFTASSPGCIDKLIFTSPGPVYPLHKELADIKAPDSIHLRTPYYSNRQGNEKANNIRTKGMAFFATAFGIKLATDREADDFETFLNSELDKSTVCDTAAVRTPVAGSGFYASIMTVNSLPSVPDPRSVLRQSGIPVLVMKGECDNQRWGFTYEYLQLFSDHQLAVIPAAGHAISLEQPGLYIQTIRRFLCK